MSSDDFSSSTELLLKSLTEKLESLSKSPVLNGGFNRLEDRLASLASTQDKMCQTLNKIYNDVYLDGGFKTKITNIENSIHETSKLLESHIIIDQKFQQEILHRETELNDKIQPLISVKQILTKTIALFFGGIVTICAGYFFEHWINHK